MAVLVLVALAIVGPAGSFRAQEQELDMGSDMPVLFGRSLSRYCVALSEVYHTLEYCMTCRQQERMKG